MFLCFFDFFCLFVSAKFGSIGVFYGFMRSLLIFFSFLRGVAVFVLVLLFFCALVVFLVVLRCYLEHVLVCWLGFWDEHLMTSKIVAVVLFALHHVVVCIDSTWLCKFHVLQDFAELEGSSFV